MIELRGVSRRYGETTAVESVTLSVGKGELLVLLGGSGSGKTTTLKMVNRLIEPTSGKIFVEGTDVALVRPYELRRRIGYCFQKIGLFPHMTVGENVAITPKLLGWEPDRIRERVNELLEMMSLPPNEFRERLPNQLSGGQQQRVGVARAMAARPKVMLLDEPFGALDPITRDRLQQSFQVIRRDLELTAVFVTHDVSEALLLGDRIAVMSGGRIVQVGRPEELVQYPADDFVASLMETPTRQAKALDRLLRAAPHKPRNDNLSKQERGPE